MIKKSKAAKIVSAFVGLAMALSFVVAPVAHADQASDLQNQINSLMATINSLQSQLSATTGGSSMTTGYTFNTNLTVGSKSTDVMNLQKVLNMSADTKVSMSGAGSPGMETTTFGPATKAAVMKFQAKYGISPVAGYVGAITRAKLNSMGGPVVVVPPPTGNGNGNGTGTGTTLPSGGSLSVTAGSQPMNSLAPQGAARVPFTSFTVTAGSSDVTVNSVTVERSGLAQDAVFAGVVLLDQNGMQIGIAKTLNSNHQVMVGDPFVVKAGTSMMLTVAGNMASSLTSYAGQVASLNVVAVNTTASVAGAFPITGAYQVINASLTIGTATVQQSSFDPGNAQTKEIGTTGYKFSGVRVTAGSAEQVKLWSVRFNQTGSASAQDLANVMVYVDGTGYATTVSSDGKYFSALFPGGILIDKGNSKDIYIQGDITGTGAAGRTVDFDIYKTTDLNLTGVTYNYGITPTGSGTGFSGGTPWYNGSAVTVSAGSVSTIQKATSVAAQNVAVNVPNQVLGGYDVDLKGEPITVQSQIFHIATSSASIGTSMITNVTLVDSNGAVVAGPVDAVADGVSGQKVTFTDSVTYPIGKHTYTLKGRIPSGASNGAVITLSTTPLTTDWSNITGQVTGNTITLPAGTVTMNSVTVKSAALAISMSASPAAQNIVAGGQNITFANIQLDATQSGEDIRFSSLSLSKTFSAGYTTTALTGCQLWDGATALNTGTNVFNPAAAAAETITFDQSLTVAKNTIKTLTLKCNVPTAGSGTYSFTITPSVTNPSATGVTSGGTVTATGAAATSATMTVTTGSLTTTTGTSASYTIVAGGSTGNVLGTIRFHATNEAVNLNRIGLKLTSTASSSASDFVQVTLWDGSTQIGSATFLGTQTSATSTLASSLALPKDTDKDITVKLDVAQVGVSQTGTEGALIAVDSNATTDSTGTQGTGVSSGSTVNATGSTSFAGLRLFKTFPVIAKDVSLTGNGVSDGKLMRFTITPNSNGGIGINQFKFTLSTTSATVTGVNLFGYTDSGYSQGISGFTSGQISASNVNPSGATGAVTITPSSVIEIPANPTPATYYFELRGTVTGSGTAYSVNTTLLGDSQYSLGFVPGTYSAGGTALMATSTSYFNGLNNFVWSPNATTSAPATYADWTNGYGVLGLPSSGLSNNRAQ